MVLTILRHIIYASILHCFGHMSFSLYHIHADIRYVLLLRRAIVIYRQSYGIALLYLLSFLYIMTTIYNYWRRPTLLYRLKFERQFAARRRSGIIGHL